MILGKRLLAEDVESRPGNLPTVECFDQRVFVYYAASCKIDEVRGWLHHRENRRVYKVSSFGRIRREHNQVIYGRNGSRQLISTIHLIKIRDRPFHGTNSYDRHPECLASEGEGFADCSDAENTYCLAFQKTRRPALPFALILISDGAREIPAQGKHGQNRRF